LEKSSKDIHSQHSQGKLEVSLKDNEAGSHHEGGSVNHKGRNDDQGIPVELILVQELVDRKGQLLHLVLHTLWNVGWRHEIMKGIHDKEGV